MRVRLQGGITTGLKKELNIKRMVQWFIMDKELLSKGRRMMNYTCHACGIEFTEYPFVGNGVFYCSEECFPYDEMDELYLFEYVGLVSNYRYFEELKGKVKTFEDRIDLENEMDEVIEEYKSLYFGDSEGCYYKGLIIGLFEKLLKLYDEVHEILLKLHAKSEPYYAVSIYWDEIKPIIGQELTVTIFQDIVQGMNEAGLIFENISWATLKKDEMSFENYKDVVAFQSKDEKNNFYQLFLRVMDKNSNKFPLTFTSVYSEGEFSNFVFDSKFRFCHVCEHWEDEDDFSFDEERNAFVCNQWDSCSE